MSGVKTAISLDEELFARVNKLAHELHVSRSRLFSLAVEDYLRKQENQNLLARLNEAYGDHPDDEETKVAVAMKARHRQNVGQDKWE